MSLKCHESKTHTEVTAVTGALSVMKQHTSNFFTYDMYNESKQYFGSNK